MNTRLEKAARQDIDQSDTASLDLTSASLPAGASLRNKVAASFSLALTAITLLSNSSHGAVFETYDGLNMYPGDTPSQEYSNGTPLINSYDLGSWWVTTAVPIKRDVSWGDVKLGEITAVLGNAIGTNPNAGDISFYYNEWTSFEAFQANPKRGDLVNNARLIQIEAPQIHGTSTTQFPDGAIFHGTNYLHKLIPEHEIVLPPGEGVAAITSGYNQVGGIALSKANIPETAWTAADRWPAQDLTTFGYPYNDLAFNITVIAEDRPTLHITRSATNENLILSLELPDEVGDAYELECCPQAGTNVWTKVGGTPTSEPGTVPATTVFKQEVSASVTSMFYRLIRKEGFSD